MNDPFEEDVLRALRRITRAIDLHSRHLSTTYGLTGPQLVCLRVIGEQGPISPSHLAREVALSQATITGILDRLSSRQLITRSRVSSDRRVVTVAITDEGRTLIRAAPSPLQERFLSGFAALPLSERTAISAHFNRPCRRSSGMTAVSSSNNSSSTIQEPVSTVAA